MSNPAIFGSDRGQGASGLSGRTSFCVSPPADTVPHFSSKPEVDLMDNRKRSVVGFVTLVAGFSAAPVLAQDVPYTPGDMPSEYAVVDVSAPGTVRIGLSGELLLQFGGGAGTMIENEPNVDPSMTWSVQGDGRLLVVPNAAVATTGEIFSDTCPNVRFGAVTAIDRLLVRRLAASASADQLETATQYTTRYVDMDPGDACAAPAPTSLTITARKIGFRQGGEQALAAADISGVLALPHRLGPERPEWSVTQWSTAQFDTRTGVIHSGLGIASNFTHALAGGRLRVDARDGTGVPIAYEYRRLQHDIRGGDGLFAVATLSDGRRAVVYDYVPLQRKVAMPLSVRGLWYTGFSETSTDPNIAYAVDFSSDPTGNAPGLGSRRTAQFDPSTGQWTYATTPFSWTMPSGAEIVMQTFRTAAGQTVATCPAGASCTVQEARRLLVLSRFSDASGIRGATYIRLNLLETLQVDDDGDGDLDIIDQRANFYQRDLIGGEES